MLTNMSDPAVCEWSLLDAPIENVDDIKDP
jgi:hypothetical protein